MTNDQAGTVDLQRRDAVATLVINQPRRRNALSLAMWESIPPLVDDLVHDDAVRVIVVRGAGTDAFSAGADISEFEQHRSTVEKVLDYNRRTHRAFEALIDCPKPTIAMIYGFCIGGGCELALSCDLRVAADSAEFGIPAARLGISIAWVDVRRIVALVGPANAKEILFTGGRFDATRAYEMGLVNRLVPASDVESALNSLVEQIVDASPATQRWSKRAIETVLRDPTLASIPDPEADAAAIFGGADYQEGVRAFLEKRKPRFTGR